MLSQIGKQQGEQDADRDQTMIQFSCSKSDCKNPPQKILDKSTRGFTLLELLIGIAIVLIAVGLAVPIFQPNARRDARREARALVGQLFKARSLAAKAPKVAAANNAPARSAGLTIFGLRYMIYIDADFVPGNGNEEIISEVDLTQKITHFAPQITPAGADIRFKNNGTLTGNADVTILLEIPAENIRETIRVTLGGLAHIEE